VMQEVSEGRRDRRVYRRCVRRGGCERMHACALPCHTTVYVELFVDTPTHPRNRRGCSHAHASSACHLRPNCCAVTSMWQVRWIARRLDRSLHSSLLPWHKCRGITWSMSQRFDSENGL